MADPHVTRPWVSAKVLSGVVERVNGLGADLILCPGDFIAGRMPFAARVPTRASVAPLADLSAPLGVYASLGNHDWGDDPMARRTGFAETEVAAALEDAGLRLLRNSGVLVEAGGGIWLAGLESAFGEGTAKRPVARHDVQAALAGAPQGRPVVMMAHEPDAIFDIAGRADLVVSGHTHGGQADLWGWRPLTPSRHGGRFARGRHEVEGATMVVSAGLGYSGVPLRIMAPPELVLITLSGGTP